MTRQESTVGHVIIGMDPHKRSATIEIIDDRERILDQGRFGTDRDGYQAMLCVGRRHPVRTWAIEGCNGIGRHLAQRLVADGETVVDVPAKLSARARVFSTGPGRKTDPVDAHSVAVVGLRTVGLRRIEIDDATVALRLLVDRRDELGRARSQTVNRLHRLLLELLPGRGEEVPVCHPGSCTGGAVRPRDVVGKTRRRLACDLINELAMIDKRITRGARDGGRVGSTVYGRVWATARQAVFTAEVATGPLGKRPYDLRHAAVSTWLNGGAEATRIAKWAGHSLAVLLRVYAKRLDGGEQAARDRVARMLDGG
jgi:hypothetical protein